MGESAQSATRGVAPKVTVLMTTYFPNSDFQLAVNSVLGQSFQDFEFLIIDDGSGGAVRSVVSDLDDARIRLIELPKNVGQTEALNLGLSEARGEWIARLDQDDLALPGRLEQQLNAVAQQSGCVLVGAWALYIDESGEVMGQFRPPSSDGDLRYLLVSAPERLPFVHSAVMYKRLAALEVGGYPSSLRYVNDYGLWVRLAARGTLTTVPRFLASHRLHSRQASGSVSARIRIAEEVLVVIDDIPAYIPLDARMKRDWRQGRSRFVMASAGLLGIYSRDRNGARFAWQILKTELRRNPAGITTAVPIVLETIRRTTIGRNEIIRSPYP
jgi:glycosyltransferase involved in cell wall biosynthesis